MVYTALTALGELKAVSALDQARRFIHFDLRQAGIVVPQEADVFIARLIEQEVKRALSER